MLPEHLSSDRHQLLNRIALKRPLRTQLLLLPCAAAVFSRASRCPSRLLTQLLQRSVWLLQLQLCKEKVPAPRVIFRQRQPCRHTNVEGLCLIQPI
jgi:hypothetical protein